MIPHLPDITTCYLFPMQCSAAMLWCTNQTGLVPQYSQVNNKCQRKNFNKLTSFCYIFQLKYSYKTVKSSKHNGLQSKCYAPLYQLMPLSPRLSPNFSLDPSLTPHPHTRQLSLSYKLRDSNRQTFFSVAPPPHLLTRLSTCQVSHACQLVFPMPSMRHNLPH